ncbi:hypothetical protein JHK84_043005 [Glycine max]|nr:hypothetical protein JHK84_043005 [Glycine max]
MVCDLLVWHHSTPSHGLSDHDLTYFLSSIVCRRVNDHVQSHPIAKTPSQPQPSPHLDCILAKKKKCSSIGITINPSLARQTAKHQIETIDLENMEEDTSPDSAPLTFKKITRFTATQKSTIPEPHSA